MRVINSYVFRAVCAMVVGILLVRNPELTSPLIVQVIGALFFLSGLFSLATYMWTRWRARGRMTPIFPVVGLGSFLFGLLLFFFPGYFILYLMWMLGGLFVLAGINQMVALIRYRKVMPLAWESFLIPSLVLLTGALIIAHPFESASLPFVILGVCSIGYGVSEFINGIRLHRWLKRAERLALAEAEEIKDTE